MTHEFPEYTRLIVTLPEGTLKPYATHEHVVAVTLDQGALFILYSNDQTHAYAPGKWVSFTTEAEEAPRDFDGLANYLESS